jgi:DNA (cytosine-5)-methyltransferase 1
VLSRKEGEAVNSNSSKALTFGSLFTGLGGLDLGLERAGLVCKWQVEISEPMRRILKTHFGGIPKFADVREVGSHNLSAVDVIVGGFPCQDISSAGKKLGIQHGERSGLWREYYRIICELQPRYVIVENVAALRFKGRGIDIVLGDLAKSGFSCEWDCIPASAIGAPHQRDRIFLVAWRGSALANTERQRCADEFRAQLFQANHPHQSGAWASDEPLGRLEIDGHKRPGIPGHLRLDDGLSVHVGQKQRSH